LPLKDRKRLHESLGHETEPLIIQNEHDEGHYLEEVPKLEELDFVGQRFLLW
jgi:hypothetical protein